MPEKEPHSIAIIILYFGKLPWYFKYFLHSCRYNASVRFFVITNDTSFNEAIPDNVDVINRTFEEVKGIMEQSLKMKIAVEYPYKLCDFKPAFGFIFNDLVYGYDFWGCCDIDIIFGNIRNFITDKILTENDVVTPRHDYLGGYFTLYRNEKRINELFMHSKDYVKVFTSPAHYCFDETNFHFEEFAQGKHYSEAISEVESMTHVVKRLEEQKYLTAYFDYHVIDGLPGRIKWDKGIMVYKNKYEVLFYHLIMFKRKNQFPRVLKNIPATFRISQTRIYV